MASFNKVILIGNLTRDPELTYTPKGTAVAKLGIATNRKWRTETGEEREEVCFIDLVAFGRSAETLGQYVRKGDPLMTEGRLKLDQWDDKQTGQKRSKLNVIIETFQFLNRGENQGGGERGEREERQPARGNRPPGNRDYTQGDMPSRQDDAPPEQDDDVPF